MKARLKILGIGAAGGAVLPLLFWLLCGVAHVFTPAWQDCGFFTGLGLLIVGLLMVVKGGKSSGYVVGLGMRGANVAQAAINPGLAEQKQPQPKGRDIYDISKAPLLLIGAGLINLLVCGLAALF